MRGATPGEAKLPVLEPPRALPKGLPNPPPPRAGDCVPLIVAKGDGADESLLPKLRVGLGSCGAAVGSLLGEDAPRVAKGDTDDRVPPPKTLLLDPMAANGEAVEEASLEKPDEANAAVDVCTCSWLVALIVVGSGAVVDWQG